MPFIVFLPILGLTKYNNCHIIGHEVKSMREFIPDYRSFSFRGDSYRIIVEIASFEAICRLTERNSAILRYMIEGYSQREIAKILGISRRTIQKELAKLVHNIL